MARNGTAATPRASAVPSRRAGTCVWLCLAAVLASAAPASPEESTCFGTPGRGRLEDGVRLPASGANFRVFSALGADLGRTYVHSRVREVVVAAYRALEASAPGKVYVYGDTGWPLGGRFRPHKTHQNGLSVDFMVPVLDGEGRPAPLPAGPANKFGYGIEFDGKGRCGEYRIDFEAMAEHLYELHRAAQARGVGIARVIFDPGLQPRLFRTARGPFLSENLRFTKEKVWVRHDEHYYVDFALRCRPLP